MSRPEHDPSVNSEPHLQDGSFSSDPAEEAAAKKLERERARSDPAEERAVHSVFDEPVSFPNRDPVLIDQDWSCRNCGYNLRGLQTGHPCPECAHIERYEPPREGEESYAKWVATYQARATDAKSWAVTVLVPFVSLPLAVASGFLAVEWVWALSFLVVAPAMAEVLKLAAASTVIERRGYLIKRANQIYVMTIATAVVFAIAQNVIMLALYFPNASKELVLYRWFVGPFAHVACTALATRGLVPVWERAQRERRRASVVEAYPLVIAAILLHASWNAVVFFGGHLGYGF